MKSKELNICINNKEDIDNFYKNLRKYIIFKNNHHMNLSISNNINDIFKEDLKEVERIFNIKNKKDRVYAMYNSVCDYIDNHYTLKNVCQFKDNTCVCQRMGFERVKVNGCCGSCKYLGENGCITKSLACKFFYCSYIKKHSHLFKPQDIKVF